MVFWIISDMQYVFLEMGIFYSFSYSVCNSKHRQILPHTTEQELKGLPPDLQDVFNNISLHVFNTLSVRLTDGFWSDADEPCYCGNEFDQEIVWNKQLAQSSAWNCTTSSASDGKLLQVEHGRFGSTVPVGIFLCKSPGWWKTSVLSSDLPQSSIARSTVCRKQRFNYSAVDSYTFTVRYFAV